LGFDGNVHGLKNGKQEADRGLITGRRGLVEKGRKA
jgi:hypothetical protein